MHETAPQGLCLRLEQRRHNDTNDAEIGLPYPRKRAFSQAPILPKKKKQICSLDVFMMQLSGNDKYVMDHQLPKIISATNCPFSQVEQSEFNEVMYLLRLRYRLPMMVSVDDPLVKCIPLCSLVPKINLETVSRLLPRKA